MSNEHRHEHDNPEEAVKSLENEAVEALAEDTDAEKPELDSIDALAAQLVDHVDVPEVSDVKPEEALEELSAAEETVEEAAEEVVEESAETVEDAAEASEEVAETVEESTTEVASAVEQEVSDDSAFTEETEESEVSEEAEAEEDSEEVASEEESDSEEDVEEDEESEDDEEDEEDEEEDEEDEDDEEENDDVEGAAGKASKKKADKHTTKDKEESAKERSLLYTIFDTVRYIAIGLLVGILLVVFVIQRNDVYGSSMEPTLHSGDAVFVEMISVYTGNFSRGDIVTIDAKGMEGYSHEENLIKRIVGLPGETIKIEDGNVYINGVLLDESEYLPEGTKTYVGAEGQARGYQEVTLGPDEYYCMGDNRGGSNDSRRMGPFKKKQIEAKVLARIYPFNKMKFY